MKNLKLTVTMGILSVLSTALNAQANNSLASYQGQYLYQTDHGSNYMTVELIAKSVIAFSDSDGTTMYQCNESSSTCVISRQYYQGNVCWSDKLTLLPNGDILEENPCWGETDMYYRQQVIAMPPVVPPMPAIPGQEGPKVSNAQIKQGTIPVLGFSTPPGTIAPASSTLPETTNASAR